MELRAKDIPVVPGALNRFHDAIEAMGSHPEAASQLIDRHMMHAVDADFSVAVNTLHQRVGYNRQGMAMSRILRVAMRDRAGHVFRNVKEKISSLRHVNQLHAYADPKYRQPT